MQYLSECVNIESHYYFFLSLALGFTFYRQVLYTKVPLLSPPFCSLFQEIPERTHAHNAENRMKNNFGGKADDLFLSLSKTRAVALVAAAAAAIFSPWFHTVLFILKRLSQL